MATTQTYAAYVCQQAEPFGRVRCRKMFGEYIVYLNDKPVLTVCDNTVYVKKLPQIAELLSGAPCGAPYEGAKEHFILDMDDGELLGRVLPILEAETPLPRKKQRI